MNKYFHYLSPLLTIFLSAFLLFQIQPVISKYLLPFFGGGHSVWIVALLFFQTILLLGYFYSYLLTNLNLKTQIKFQLSLLFIGLSLVAYLGQVWNSPVTPSIESSNLQLSFPALALLTTLLLSVGLPFFILSSTSILIQRWFNQLYPKINPYPLYALSNLGSLLGILTYPFLTEPLLTLTQQGNWWSVGFVMYILIFSSFILRIRKLSESKPLNKINFAQTDRLITQSPKTTLLWLGLPFLSSLILLSTTSKITQSIAPVPFLWLLPLSLYLFSYILSFSSEIFYKRNIYIILLIISIIALVESIGTNLLVWEELLVYSFYLFSCFMFCHGEVYRQRPKPEHLAIFYLFTSLGGVLGSLFVSLIAPIIFPDYWEFYIGMALVATFSLMVFLAAKDSWLNKILPIATYRAKIHSYVFAIIVISVVSVVLTLLAKQSDYLEYKSSRNFYSTLHVYIPKPTKEQKFLTNGQILHGSQYLDPKISNLPTSYYNPRSAMALAILYHPKRMAGQNLDIGVIGLGAGTIASYGQTGDRIDFYDINPQVIEIAKNDFTYLSQSKAKIQTILGDGRLSLDKQDQQYDILILDAFSDDAIPVHLLTKQAMAVYTSKLKDQNGVIAIHISNTYLDLSPVVVNLANDQKLKYLILNSEYRVDSAQPSNWAILTPNQDLINSIHYTAEDINSTNLKNPIFTVINPKPTTLNKVGLWTDDYSNLFHILK